MGLFVNESVKCTVENCKHHSKTKDYCSLNCVSIGCHEACPTETQCTDCLSFEAK